jgi:hypothetical protein
MEESLHGNANQTGEQLGIIHSKFAPWAQQELLKATDSEANYSHIRSHASAKHETVLSESVFDSILTLERQRAERSRKPFVLMLLDAHLENGSATRILTLAVDVVLATRRETDLVGWYRKGTILGVIFTEVMVDPKHLVTETLRSKIEAAAIKCLGPTIAGKIPPPPCFPGNLGTGRFESN